MDYPHFNIDRVVQKGVVKRLLTLLNGGNYTNKRQGLIKGHI